MHIPFIEIAGAGIFFRDDRIEWVELSRLGKSVKVVDFGQIPIEGAGYKSRANSIDTLSELKERWKDKALHVGCGIPPSYTGSMTLDAPFFEDPEELDEWIEKELKNLSESFENEIVVSHQLYEIHEDLKRVHFVWADATEMTYAKELCEEASIYPQFISAAGLETGYGLIFDEDFVDGASALLTIDTDHAELACFQNGLAKNYFRIEGGVDVSPQYYLDTALANLKSEEGSYEEPELFREIYVQKKDAFSDLQLLESERRRLTEFTTLGGLKTPETIPSSLVKAAGLAVKAIYPGIDELTFISDSDKEIAEAHYGKKELVKTSGLLFAPLIVMLLLIYAAEAYIGTHLSESTQVLSLIQDKIEVIEEEQAEVGRLLSEFEGARSLITERSNLARHFELIARSIPSNVWLTELKILDEREGKVQVLGYGQDARQMNRFINTLSNRDNVEKVDLDISERRNLLDVLPQAANSGGSGELIEFQLTIIVS